MYETHIQRRKRSQHNGLHKELKVGNENRKWQFMVRILTKNELSFSKMSVTWNQCQENSISCRPSERSFCAFPVASLACISHLLRDQLCGSHLWDFQVQAPQCTGSPLCHRLHIEFTQPEPLKNAGGSTGYLYWDQREIFLPEDLLESKTSCMA